MTFDPNLCAHSARCLAGQPAVFDVRRRKWIDGERRARGGHRAGDRSVSVLRAWLPAAEHAPVAGIRGRSGRAVVTLGTDGPLTLEGRVRVRTASR